MFTAPVNYWAILVGAISNMIVGSVWYSKALFAEQWMKALGKKKEELGSPQTAMVVMFIGALVQSYILAHFIAFAGEKTPVGGAKIAFWAWLGFVAVVQLGGSLFEGRPMKLFKINVGYSLVALLIMGAILGAWH